MKHDTDQDRAQSRVPEEFSPVLDFLEPLQAIDSGPQTDFDAARQRYLKMVAMLPPRITKPAVQRHTGENKRIWFLRTGKELKPVNILLSLVLAAAIAIGGGAGTVYASQDSSPEDLLYPVKLFSEDVQLALNRDPLEEIHLLLQFTNERTLELQELVEDGSAIPEEFNDRLEKHLILAQNNAARLDADSMNASLLQMQQQIRSQLQIIELVQNQINMQNQQSLLQAKQIMQTHQNQLQGALEDPLGFRNRLNAERPEDAPEQPDIMPGAGSGNGNEDAEANEGSGNGSDSPGKGKQGENENGTCLESDPDCTPGTGYNQGSNNTGGGQGSSHQGGSQSE